MSLNMFMALEFVNVLFCFTLNTIKINMYLVVFSSVAVFS